MKEGSAFVISMAAMATLAAATSAGGASSRQSPQPAAGPQRPYVEAELLVRINMELPVEPEIVFDAWTRAEQLVAWFPTWAEMTVTEGGEYRFGWDGWEEEWTGTFIEVERPERLAFTWHPPASVFPGGAYPTAVAITLEGIDGRTRLTLEHSGFQGGAEMESHKEAWTGYLYNLRAYLLLQR